MKKLRKNSRQIIVSFLLMLILISFDQFSKWLAYVKLHGQQDIEVIKDIFHLHYLENTSAAFSLDPVTIFQNIFHTSLLENDPALFLKSKMIFFIVLTLVVVVLLYILFLRIPATRRFLPLNIALCVFISGAIGNFIDRIIHNYVIDFFYLKVINFPVFNVADIYVTVTAVLFFILLVFYYKESDIDEIFTKNKSSEL